MTAKNALVWGATGGIGRALIKRLNESGWQVIAVCRSGETVPEQTALIVEISDITDEFSLQQAVLEAGYDFEKVDLSIYAVGDIIAKPTRELTLDQWKEIIGANLTGAFLATKHSIPLLDEKAHLIFLGAIDERLRLPGFTAYAAAKAGLEAFAEALGKEERKKRVTVVRPSAVETSLWEKVPMNPPKSARSPEEIARQIIDAHQEGRSGILDLT